MKQYDLHWNSIPMGALTNYHDWYYPYLGQGVYMFVLATNQNNVYTVYYVGKSQDIGERWYSHLFNLFLNPNAETSVPNSAEDFLDNPVEVFNQNALAQGLPDRNKIQKTILSKTWFCFTEINCFNFNLADKIEHVEYVLQEAVKKHVGITTNGCIGDSNFRKKPKNDMYIHNHFCREFLQGTLPKNIEYDQSISTVRISG